MSYALINLYKNLSPKREQGEPSSLTEDVSPLLTEEVFEEVRPPRERYAMQRDKRASLTEETPLLSPEVIAPLCLGIGEITAMGVDQNTLYCYWEINHDLSYDLILTIYNMTEDIFLEIEVRQKVGHIYVGIDQRRGDAVCEFQVAMGVKIRTEGTISSNITLIAVSNIVSVPPLSPSNRLDQEWWSPEGERPLQGHYVLRSALPELCLVQE